MLENIDISLDKNKICELIREAFCARKLSYSPYSHYSVGAALLCDKGIVKGCNIENSSYGATNCAERTAIFKAVSEGYDDFTAIAIVGGRHEEEETVSDYAYPCGVCRQVMREFCNENSFLVIVAKSETEYKCFLLNELLPNSFGPDNL